MAENKNLPATAEEAAQQVVKRGRGRHSVEKFGEENTKPGDNSQYLRQARVAMNLPPIDISDPAQVEERINEYLDYCEDHDKKPGMVELSLWLGVNRDTLKSWKRGEFRSATHKQLIERYVTLLESQWTDYMMNNKVNPASGIFLAKNLFGYKDTQDVVIEPKTPLGEETDAKQLEEKYKDSVIYTTAEEVDDK